MKKIMISLVAVIFATSSISISTYAQETGTFTDSRDGHVYKTVKIGNQIWMAENLAYKTSSGSWAYNNNESNVTTYGRLYNWAAAMNGDSTSYNNPSGVQGVCPNGWHLPSGNEWTELVDFLGGYNVAGGKMKETGYEHWNSPNSGATNESGFTALPGGYRAYNDGTFNDLGNDAHFWSTSEGSSSSVWGRGLYYNTSEVSPYGGGFKNFGYSVRCLQD